MSVGQWYIEELPADGDVEPPDPPPDEESDLEYTSGIAKEASEVAGALDEWKFHVVDCNPVPDARGGHSWVMCGDRKMVLFGGSNLLSQPFGDTWVLDEPSCVSSVAWRRADTTGSPPCPRSGHAAVAIGGSRLLVFGGMDPVNNVTFNDVYLLDAETMAWSSLDTEGAPPLNSHTMMLHGELLLVFGGAGPDGPAADVYTLDLHRFLHSNSDANDGAISPPVAPLKWMKRHCEGDVPLPREMHAACAVSINAATSTSDLESNGSDTGPSTALIVCGGRASDGTVSSDTFALDLQCWRWRRLGDMPEQRCAHAAWKTKDGNVAIFGGWDGAAGVASCVHVYDVASNVWHTPSWGGESDPSGRFAHSVCCGGDADTGPRVYVFGGVCPAEMETQPQVLRLEQP